MVGGGNSGTTTGGNTFMLINGSLGFAKYCSTNFCSPTSSTTSSKFVLKNSSSFSLLFPIVSNCDSPIKSVQVKVLSYARVSLIPPEIQFKTKTYLTWDSNEHVRLLRPDVQMVLADLETARFFIRRDLELLPHGVDVDLFVIHPIFYQFLLALELLYEPHSLDVSLEHSPGGRMSAICSNDEISFDNHCLLRIPAIEIPPVSKPHTGMGKLPVGWQADAFSNSTVF